MQLPHPGAVIQTMHGADEHIPVSALQFGANVFEELLLGF
jgi:acetylornithine deacetylase/succinyl-diaminopimelate desuccinylase-like protein